MEGQDRQQHFDEHHVHHHQQTHGAIHPAPAGENVRSAAAAAYAKGQRCRNGQHRQNEIPLRHLKKQFTGLKHDDETENDDQQPRSGQINEKSFIRQLDGRGVRHLHHVDDNRGHIQADVADLRTGHQQERKDKGAGEQQLGVIGLEAYTGHHAAGCLKHQIAQQQRPAYAQHDLPDGRDDRHVCFQIGKVEAHQVKEHRGKVFPTL